MIVWGGMDSFLPKEPATTSCTRSSVSPGRRLCHLLPEDMCLPLSLCLRALSCPIGLGGWTTVTDKD